MVSISIFDRLGNHPHQVKLTDQAITLSGVDVISWLQGQITQNTDPLHSGTPIHACLCSATGMLQTTISIYPQADSLIAITPHPQVLLDRINRFVIMEDVSAVLDPRPLVHIVGSNQSGPFPKDRTGLPGFDTFENQDLPEVPDSLLNTLEIAAGIPRLGIDSKEKTLPPELGPRFETLTIHYQKGCYVGQEVLQRIHSRGHTNKTWIGLKSDSPIPIIELPGVGRVTRSATHPQLGFIGAAMLRNEFAIPDTQIEIGDQLVTVASFPIN
jgi:folate-binding protein YgfZ